MYNTLFNRGLAPVAEQVLYYTERRHVALANNIANADTPNYKAIDAPEGEFREALERAFEERDRRWVPTFEFEGTRNVRVKPGGGLDVLLKDTLDLPPRVADTKDKHDDNNVDIDSEFVKLVRNAQRHNMAAEMLRHQWSLLEAAIRERVA